MFEQLNERLRSRSAALLFAIDTRLDHILKLWLFLAGIAAMARLTLAPNLSAVTNISNFSSSFLLVTAPFVSTLLALHWFGSGEMRRQPSTRLALIGRWRSVSQSDAEGHPLYGSSGMMVSLLVGMMLNVVLRSAEYLAAMPPIPDGAPKWLSTLHFAMTVDVVVFSSLYMVAFVAALRKVPLFPRLLVAIWLGDLVMQLTTAQLVADTHLPATVAGALQALLAGNVKKVLISMALWLPYLILSTRVNITFRHREPA